MMHRARSFGMCCVALVICSLPLAAQSPSQQKQLSFSVPANSSVVIINTSGNIFVRPGSARMVIVSASSNSADFQVDSKQRGSRVQVRTRGNAQLHVDYEVTVPQTTNVTVEDESGEVRVENLRGSVNVSGESPDVQLRELANSTIQVQTVDGRITVTNVSHSRLQLTTSSGAVQLESVTGPQIVVRSTSGPIRFLGAPGENGSYRLANHSGDIELLLPQTAAAEVAARSAKGHVTSEFSFAKDEHLGFQPEDGRAVGGVLNGGGAQLDVRSFSGAIRLKKQ